jgi:hypothetical protein
VKVGEWLQIFTWHSDKPKLLIDLRSNMYADKINNLCILDQKNEYEDNQKGIAIEIANVGKIPTTIRYIAIQPYKKKKRHFEGIVFSAFDSSTSPLPSVLKPGEIWSGFYLDQTKFVELSKEFDLIVEISHSFSKKPIVQKLEF